MALDRQNWIAGLEKGLGLIEAFNDLNPRLTATEASRRCGLTRTAARRYLLTLAHLGYVDTDGKQFWLTPRILRLGQAYLVSARLPAIVQPFLQRVATATQEPAYVSVLDGDDIVCIARNGANREMNTGYVLGSRVPAQVTAAGIVILAQWAPTDLEAWLATHPTKIYTAFTYASTAQLRQQIALARAQGWALSEQQLQLKHRGIAVPLRDHHGVVLGAINVTMPMGREPAEDALARVLPVLQETAQSMRSLL
ncbi:MAG: Pca operon regulatory protein [Paracidovorax wautersii]|uniref:Pca operon regulatory protein n=1 Tax=Paracidovorax wautersii TaxID=1177982 RepID=A0A7V8JPI9_9BURK|nr:MAG: Pca operon regulatory protein [Paracidovorax wautersii]